MSFERRKILLMAATAMFLSACGDDASKPYFTFAGGGFVFNYRNADLYYGFVLKPERQAPPGAMIEVDFELTQLGQHDVQRIAMREGQLQYTFRTPDLQGVKPGKDYQAVVRLMNEGKEIARYSRAFKTDIDTSSLPNEPLVVGPGYQPNPVLPSP